MALQLELPEDFPIPPGLALQLAGTCASHPFLYAKVSNCLLLKPQVKSQTGLDTTGSRATGSPADKNTSGPAGLSLSLSLLLCLPHPCQGRLDWSVEGAHPQALLSCPPAPRPGEVQ